MFRFIAFASGVAIAAALVLFVMAGVSRRAIAPRPVVVTSDPSSDPGQLTASPLDPRLTLPHGFDENGGEIDIQGDEVTPAVATYQFDAQGNIYESHAPQTEVPRLGAPKS